MTLNNAKEAERVSQPFMAAVFRHLLLVGVAVSLAVLFAVPLGIACSGRPRLASALLYVNGLIMTIPSVALYGLMMPILALVGRGIGMVPAMIALFLYSQLPMLRNTIVGLRNVDPAIVDAARGMGMTRPRLLFTVRLPLAFPLIMAGIRSSAVMGVGVAAIAAYIGAGGLGTYIMLGISNSNRELILTGAVGTTVMALVLDLALGTLQKRLERRVGLSR
jgi:osmoprotectant transport system permease protein